jgi:hypothetical protein
MSPIFPVIAMLGRTPRVLESTDDLRRLAVHAGESGIARADLRVSVYDSAGVCFRVAGGDAGPVLSLSGPYRFEDLRAAIGAHYANLLSGAHLGSHADCWDSAAEAVERAAAFGELASVCRQF